MFGSTYEIGRVFGVPIKIDLSLIVLAVYLCFMAIGDVRDVRLGIIIGLTIGVLLILSVTLHELGHTFAALRFGCRVRDITLMLMGGRAAMLDLPRQPWKEFVVTAAGLSVSAALWIGGLLAARHLGTRNPFIIIPLVWLALMNKMLLLFNLLPAFPMDGGRLLRSVLAQYMGRLRATYVAMRIGRVVAIGMGIWAFRDLGNPHFLLALIALFVYQGAGAEYRMVQMESTQGNDRFGGFWGRPPPPPDDQAVVSPPPYRRGRDISDVFRNR